MAQDTITTSGIPAGVAESDRAAARGGPRLFLVVATVVLLSRLPFLGPGYGTDADAWRVALAARTIATTGRYAAARCPGNPVQEFVCSLLWRGGPLALDGATALMAALGAGFFTLIVRRLGGRDGVLAGAALASVPAFYAVSVQALDYTWALALALAAIYFALGGRSLVAGLLAGLAIGCRVTSGAWLVPLSLVLAAVRPPGARTRAILALTASALIVGTLAFVPLYLEAGPAFLRFYDWGYPGLRYVIRAATLDLWGVPGTLAILLALPLAWRGARRAPPKASIPPPASPLITAAWLTGLVLFAVAFLRLPYKSAYLFPALPLVFVLLGQWLERRVFVAVCLAMILSPWILGVGRPGPEGGPPPSPTAMRLQGPQGSLVLDWRRGPLLATQATRKHGVRYADQSLERALRLRARSVVVAWDWLPQIEVRLGGRDPGPVRFVYLLTRDQLRVLRERRVEVYHLAGADWADARTCGVSLREYGSRLLDELP